MKKVLHYFLLVLSGLGLGSYLFMIEHYEAIVLALVNGAMPSPLQNRLIGYLAFGIVILLVSWFIADMYAKMKPLLQKERDTTKYAFYPFILLLYFPSIFPEVSRVRFYHE